jgi:hypothetical protein
MDVSHRWQLMDLWLAMLQCDVTAPLNRAAQRASISAWGGGGGGGESGAMFSSRTAAGWTAKCCDRAGMHVSKPPSQPGAAMRAGVGAETDMWQNA